MNIVYTEERLREAVANSFSYAGVLRYLGLVQAGGTQCHVKRRIKHFGIDTSHFTGKFHNKGKRSLKRLSAAEILTINRLDEYKEKPEYLKRALLEIGREYKCEECGVSDTYNGKPINLEIDHIDGDNRNNLASNLRFLCPNCHSQTSTYCRKKTKGYNETDKEPKTPKLPKSKQFDLCPICGTEKPISSKTCSYECANKKSSRVDWENIDLLELAKTMSKVQIAKKLGVSDVTVAKRLKMLQEDHDVHCRTS
jgi:hypothetical protein